MTQKSHNQEVRTAVFAGSFNPFTSGHYDIVMRGLNIFDRVVICVGINANKTDDSASAAARAENIRRIFADDKRVDVACWSGLTTDFANSIGACALLRGMRSVKDFEYERDMADANMHIGGIETVLLLASPQYAWISSSVVRELQAYGRDVSDMLP